MKDHLELPQFARRDLLKLAGAAGSASLTSWLTACSAVPKTPLALAPKALLAPQVKVVNIYFLPDT